MHLELDIKFQDETKLKYKKLRYGCNINPLGERKTQTK